MCQTDNSFVFHAVNYIIILLVYMDNILLIGSDTKFIDLLLKDLHNQFDMRNL